MAAVPSLLRQRPVAPRPHLRVVGPVRHVRGYVALMCLVGALGIFGVVALSALAAESAFEARALEAEVERLAQRHDELEAEVAALAAPERVRDVAVHELGMVPAGQPGFLAVRDRSAEGAEAVGLTMVGDRSAEGAVVSRAGR